jgi:hypothetical protein
LQVPCLGALDAAAAGAGVVVAREGEDDGEDNPEDGARIAKRERRRGRMRRLHGARVMLRL